MVQQQADPLQSITLALRPIFEQFGVKKTNLGWPDTKFLEADVNLPSIAIFSVSGTATHQASRYSVHAIVNNGDGTATAYYEKERLFYLLQISLFTNTLQERSNIGWQIQQYFATNPQLQYGIEGVETSVFKLKGVPRDDQGETNFYQRDLTFEVSARMLSSKTANIMKQLQANQTSGTGNLPNS